MKAWVVGHRDAALLALRRLAGAPVNSLLSLLAIGVALTLPAGGQMLVANALHLAGTTSAVPQISVFMAGECGTAGGIRNRVAPWQVRRRKAGSVPSPGRNPVTHERQPRFARCNRSPAGQPVSRRFYRYRHG
jgi:hypothetical protein